MIRLNEIPQRIGYYMAGFADGEGSFNMNDGGKRRYTDEAILKEYNEKILRDSTPNSSDDGMIESELHGDMESQAEMI